MINVLLIDDSYDKVASVVSVLRGVSENIKVDIVVDVISAQQKLANIKYDLLVLDMNLPIRIGEVPALDAGKNLLEEINRAKSLKSPSYIVTVTQYIDSLIDVSDIWLTLSYSKTSNNWKSPLINLIKHIIKAKIPATQIEDVKPTIFVEGKTDEKILIEAIKIFNPNLLNNIYIKSDKSAGASWVARQIIVWAHSLKKNNSAYCKAIGLLDNDNASKESISEINRVIKSDSAESKTYKIIKLSNSYAKHLQPIFKKGLHLPVAIEEMFPPAIWDHALRNGWMKVRDNAESLLINPNGWNKYELSLKEYVGTLGLEKDEDVYLNVCKNDCKELFANYVITLDVEEKKSAFCCFHKLVDDITTYFDL